MDKEIIIDGVDVAGCEFYENGNCNCVDARNCEGYIFDEVTPCIGNPECNFKQLARKTQECEELEKTYDTLQNTWIKQSKYLHRYRRAFEEIKEIAQVSNMPPCLGVYDCSECANCHDALTSYGELCMQYGLYKILQKCEDISSASKET